LSGYELPAISKWQNVSRQFGSGTKKQILHQIPNIGIIISENKTQF